MIGTESMSNQPPGVDQHGCNATSESNCNPLETSNESNLTVDNPIPELIMNDCHAISCNDTDDSEPLTSVDPPLEVSSPMNEVTRAFLQRKQPLMELVSSEEGYVRRLRFVKDYYMPVVSCVKTHPTPTASENTAVPGTPSSTNNSIGNPREQSTNVLTHPPAVPDDLAARWRIVWGNWIQLCEWHSTFLEKLTNLVENDPDRIPKLFIESRARLRSIYSKYCENHRKAALIAEQYREYFEELRVHLNDKEDVVSYLMQPVQRIMRYQLPMTEIVKYTQRACSPDLPLWKKALDIMKEIPKDTQLILEAARIDGFPGVITALGNILIRGDLLVATTTRDQLLETVTGYKLALQECASSMGICDGSLVFSKKPSSQSFSRTPVSSVPVGFSESSGPSVPSSTPPTGLSDSPQSPDAATGLFTGNLKFIESRLFLFEQMLLVTEETKPKRRVTSTDTYAQSTYQFKAAINVNKMRYEAHWYNCNLPNGHTNADAAVVDQLLSTGITPDELRFAILDQTPGRAAAVYVINPITSANREAWVVQLRDIQRMQQEFLLALQDPRRFKTGNMDDTWDAPVPGDNGLSRLDPQSHVSVQNNKTGPPQQQHHQQRQRKWPSFTMKRPSRLGSASSPSGTKDTSPTVMLTKPGSGSTLKEPSMMNDRGSSTLARSLSAERQPMARSINAKGSGLKGESADGAYRKSSLSANSSIKISHHIQYPDDSDMQATGSKGKKRNAFVNLFTRNKSKQRGKAHTAPATSPTQPTLITSTPSRTIERSGEASGSGNSEPDERRDGAGGELGGGEVFASADTPPSPADIEPNTT